MHALSRAIALYAENRGSAGPVSPRTSFNFGMIEGGLSINSIPTAAQAKLDIRSEAPSKIDEYCAELTQLWNARWKWKTVVQPVGVSPPKSARSVRGPAAGWQTTRSFLASYAPSMPTLRFGPPSIARPRTPTSLCLSGCPRSRSEQAGKAAVRTRLLNGFIPRDARLA